LAALGTLALNVVPGTAYEVAYIIYAKTHHVHFARDLSNFPKVQLVIAQCVAYAPLVLFLLAVVPRLARVSLADLGLRRPTGREIAIGVAGSVAMWVVALAGGAVAAALTHRHDTEDAVELLRGLRGPLQIGLFVVVACVFAPIVEELTFRVLVFNALTKYAPVAVAAIVSGILFGAEHVLGKSPGQLLTIAFPLALTGIVLAYVYATTRCFWSNVTTHACFNGVQLIALIVFHAT
jgi:hypothetical protein